MPQFERGDVAWVGKLPLRDQFCFSRRFICLLARSGLGVSNAACNDLMAVLDNFPIPVPLVVTANCQIKQLIARQY
jgi:hypothetical protein